MSDLWQRSWQYEQTGTWEITTTNKNEDIKDLALSVGLQENTEEWENFFSVAKISAGRIPDDIMSDEEVLQHLPLFLRTISGQKLSDNKLKELIDIIKTG